MEQTLRTKYYSKLTEIMDQMKEKRYSDPQIVVTLGEELFQLGEQEQDNYSKAFACLYICDAYYSLGECNRAIDYGLKGLRMQEQNHYHELLVQQYNILGLIYSNQNQEYYAVDCYNKGLELARYTNNVKQIGFITNNIGIIYVKLKDYEKAIEYYTLGYEVTKKNGESAVIHEEAWNLNLTDAYIAWGKTEQAQEQLDMAKKNLAKSKVDRDEILINCLQMSIYYQQKRYEEAFLNACEGMRMIKESNRHLVYYPAAIEVLNILIKIYQDNENKDDALGQKALSYAREWKDECYKMADHLQLIEDWLMYYDAVIELHQYLNEQEALTQALLAHRKWMAEQNENIRKSRLGGIQNQLALGKITEEKKKMQRMNEKLQVLSEVDQLTGAKNRYALNEYMEKVFMDGIRAKKTIGLFLLDVDFFKEFNDTYGHIAGDECLANVSKTIIDMIGKDGMVARYGGDEFLIVLHDKTMEQTTRIAKQIRDAIMKLLIPHKKSQVSDYVTVSLGGINCVPEHHMRISDYINSADSALYRVKRTARNNYYVADHLI